MIDPLAAAFIAVEENAELLKGPEGPEGPEGPKGDKGDPGSQGATGQKGDKGDDGVTGPEGPQGKRGQRGPQGERGLQGTKGDKGERGPAGAGNMFPRPAGGGGGSGSGSALTVKDEGVNLDTAVTSIDFTGAGVTATNIGHAITVAVTGSGSGAPFPPWTEGGHGDVTATVDAGETDPTLVILATTDQEAVTAHLFEIQDSNASRVFYIDNEDLSGPGGTMRFGPVDSSPGGLDTSFLVTWDDNTNLGNVIAEVRSQDSFIELDSFLDKNTSTNSYSQIQISAAADQTRPTIRVTNRGTGARVFGVLAAGSPVFAQIVTPADSDFSASEVGFWFDDTNGSAAPQWKGKQADGTVVGGPFGGSGSGDALTDAISQTGHGLSVGDVVRLDGTDYVTAQADSAVDAEVVGIVSAVAGADDFTLTTHGRIAGLAGLTAGTAYFLSDTVAGTLTDTEPTDTDTVSKPVLVADTTTTGYIFNFRGAVNSTGGGGSGVVGSADYLYLIANYR